MASISTVGPPHKPNASEMQIFGMFVSKHANFTADFQCFHAPKNLHCFCLNENMFQNVSNTSRRIPFETSFPLVKSLCFLSFVFPLAKSNFNFDSFLSSGARTEESQWTPRKVTTFHSYSCRLDQIGTGLNPPKQRN